MNSYVLVLSVGPVQSFISSARRSRDLWSGSWLLSELAKAVASNLHNNGAELIFPFINNADDLEPDSELSVGNKIQVIFKDIDEEQLIKYANQAKETANTHFQKLAEKALKDLGEKNLRLDIWNKQKDDYVEVQYAWAKIDNNYATASENAGKYLSARKATRDFIQFPSIDKGLPKSSLDGARETVLPEKHSETLRHKLGLSQSEQLDCVGVMKRLIGKTEQFTPITRVSADSWLKNIADEQLANIKEHYEKLVGLGVATRVKGNHQIYDKFPYDGQFLYRFRLEAEKNQTNDEEIKQVLDDLNRSLKDIRKQYGEPCPYWVMLLADGDRMGELLDKAKSEEHHRQITQGLSHFASDVPEIMRKNNAQCVYSGGDDVLGLVSLVDSVKCAEALKDCFAKHLDGIAEHLGVEKSPTLSVGLAICHINMPLGNVRALAKRAEKTAKGEDRNALGIHLDIRSGAEVNMRIRWDDSNALYALSEWMKAYQDNQISSRVAYDCRAIFTRTTFKKEVDKQTTADIRRAEFSRMLERTRLPNGQKLELYLKDLLNDRLKQFNGDLDKLATELLIARWLSAKTQRDLGRE